MNSKHRKTLAAEFADPVNGGIHFSRIDGLLVAFGCELSESRGSAVMFARDGCSVQFHRPHPNREALRYRVKAARKFLGQIGEAP